ncbi:hypothetical protein RvY_11154 [Ramazzottius varieornatus]|uniref:HTH psq-type domain-containing protein n=1 Tax=Ramazzottius varieornatus TaxID=947166 RepID=A0A1D1VF66_RAMVA|nr:hypothetical protein RvY_11154 [Ramazzottius varieornatus]
MSEGFKSKTRRKYTEESLMDAVRAVANGLSARQASLTFRVPRITIVKITYSSEVRPKDEAGHDRRSSPSRHVDRIWK